LISKGKIKDAMDGKPKAYEEIKHQHTGEPTRLEGKTCQRCHYDVAEQSFVDYVKKHDDSETTTQRKSTHVFKFLDITVHRGRFDDVVAWDVQWQ